MHEPIHLFSRDRFMTGTYRWGFVGLGSIAHQFAQDLRLVEGAVCYAAASRSMNKAAAFADTYGFEQTYGSYAELFADDQVDIVYIATPHDSHATLTIAALEQGKHVMCEKPVALNRKQAERMVEAARANSRFFMEAFLSRFNPSVHAVIDTVRAGTIGQVRYLNADFSFRVDNQLGSRMYNMDTGGGSLLDMGVYPIFLAYTILGIPDRIQASSKFYPTGADLQTAMLFDYPDAQALLYSSFSSQSNMRATISGTEGRLVLNPVWHETDSYSFFRNDDDTEHRVDLPRTGKGFYYEILECHRCIREGRTESMLWGHQHSLDLIEIVDRVRAKTGLRYPNE